MSLRWDGTEAKLDAEKRKEFLSLQRIDPFDQVPLYEAIPAYIAWEEM
jgi:hypothetical protein